MYGSLPRLFDEPRAADAAEVPAPFLDLSDVERVYPAGDIPVCALRGVTTRIRAGEMVAILGASGSGKSTLMNILGCLDKPSRGIYRVGGREVANLSREELAALRRESFGFIFQRYHLLPHLTALENVEVPAMYTGMAAKPRTDRACELLRQLGLGARMHHKPPHLSGGQQQRVSIARALMNGGQVILADEPTGALDSRAGAEVLDILCELHSRGRTIILVTHDLKIADRAERVLELNDGEVISDRLVATERKRHTGKARSFPVSSVANSKSRLPGFVASLSLAAHAVTTHRLRTALTVLGIIIGIAAVTSMVALGNGSRQQILSSISSLGTNTIDIYPGKSFGDTQAAQVHTLRASDAEALSKERYVDSASPNVAVPLTVRVGREAGRAQVLGVGGQFLNARGLKLIEGSGFGDRDVAKAAQSVVIDAKTRRTLFGDRQESVIGESIVLGTVPCKIVGVTEALSPATDALSMWVPYTTALRRLLGQEHVSSITVRVSDTTPMETAEQAITQLMLDRHGRKDFFLNNVARIRVSMQSANETMTLLTSLIGAIALLVGGIGVMNIMLVSVVERTREVGLRIAVGARRTDILRQFLTEATLVCLIGGCLGVLTAVAAAYVVRTVWPEVQMLFSPLSIVAAFACATGVGIVFGLLPARRAAAMDPVEALARE